MRADAVFPERVELSVSRPENLLLIENQAESVVIRAARDNFSPRRKAFFIRYLAAEGYIPASYQFLPGEAGFGPGPTWVIDRSWWEASAAPRPKTVRRVLRAILYASLLWLGLMTFAFLHASH